MLDWGTPTSFSPQQLQQLTEKGSGLKGACQLCGAPAIVFSLSSLSNTALQLATIKTLSLSRVRRASLWFHL